MNLPLTIGINADNAARAEAAIDWIYQLASRTKQNHVLLAFDSDCSPEQRSKIKITADLAFLTVQEFIAPALPDERRQSELARRNALFLAAAEHCQKCFRTAWVWLEANCTPTNPGWLENLTEVYHEQPYRYLGVHLKPTADSNERFLHRVAIYHMGCFNDIAKACSDRPDVPCEVAAGMNLVVRSSKTRLIQPLKIVDETSFSQVWPEAQIVVGDDAGALIEYFRENGIHLKKKRGKG